MQSSFDLMDGTPDTPGVVSQNLEVEDDAGSEVQEEGSTIGVDKRFSKMSIPGRIESLDSQELGPRDPVYERPVTFMSDSETLLKPPGCNRHSTPLSAPLHRRQQAVNFGESSSLHVQGLLAEGLLCFMLPISGSGIQNLPRTELKSVDLARHAHVR